jgi:hypothetical protein
MVSSSFISDHPAFFVPAVVVSYLGTATTRLFIDPLVPPFMTQP